MDASESRSCFCCLTSVGASRCYLRASADVSPSRFLLAGEYLDSLLQTGTLVEASGLPDEAMFYLQEGFQLANALHAQPFQVAFAAKLAEVYRRLHDYGAAAQVRALKLAQKVLLCAYMHSWS